MDAALSAWIGQLKQCDATAIEILWRRYFEKLVRLARRKLHALRLRVADEEDVALSALNSFVRGMRAERFPQLNDPADLWKLLVTITARKAVAQQRRHFARKRGAGEVRGESAFRADDDRDAEGIARVLGSEPTPELAAQFAEQVGHMLQLLGDASLREVALLKLEGYSTEEIADHLQRNRRTVERKVLLIRSAWQEYWESEQPDD
jgi:DNA-directed RNA polymerase specialized sigma24 family protein